MDWIELLVKDGNNVADQLFENLLSYLPDVDHITDFFKSGKLKVRFKLLFNDLNKNEWIVYISKILRAEKIELFDDYFEITSKDDLIIESKLIDDYRDGKKVPFLTYADNWDNYFPEYDIVTELFPIVSPNLFKLAKADYSEVNSFTDNERINWLSTTGNGLAGIGILQSVQLIPEIGFGSIPKKEWYREEYHSRILNYEMVLKNFWLFELNNSGKTIIENNKDYILRVFISPTILRDNEKTKLEDIKEKNKKYYEGVQKGWSVIFMGKTAEVVSLSGEHKASELLINIPDSFLTSEKIEYYYVNGEKANL
ncbi:hypothetical protein [Enterococcus thailandicus]|uniref:hypothetical protein n=1 Tax=Enterococcus thailandicus TaxID=417368 RepID=UPI0022EBCFE9|nr:hypothetical protein [Enterococcus thailandicus]MDA3964904.1 hypothetical protein [Enterococcus thailandicus]